MGHGSYRIGLQRCPTRLPLTVHFNGVSSTEVQTKKGEKIVGRGHLYFLVCVSMVIEVFLPRMKFEYLMYYCVNTCRAHYYKYVIYRNICMSICVIVQITGFRPGLKSDKKTKSRSKGLRFMERSIVCATMDQPNLGKL